MGWTDKQITDLKNMAAEGLSAGQICKQMQVSRNAVCGKLFRLGLTSHGRAPRELREPRAPKPSRRKRYDAAYTPTSVMDEAGAPLTLETLNPDQHCKWPVGDPQDRDFHYCGCPRGADSPYCDFHHVRAHQPRAATGGNK